MATKGKDFKMIFFMFADIDGGFCIHPKEKPADNHI